MGFTIKRLTSLNVEALNGWLSEEDKAHVTVTATTARFDIDPERAYALVANAQQRAGEAKGLGVHPHRSFHAVLAKIRKVESS